MVPAEFLTCASRVPLLQSVLECGPISAVIRAPEQPSPDPLPLLAALSQASAVLVAIIGGFLVSRLVAISSEREGIRRLLTAADGRVSHVQSELHDAAAVRLGLAEASFYDDGVDKLIEDPELDLDALVRDAVIRGTTEEELKPYALELRRRILHALDLINAQIMRGDDKRLTLKALYDRGLTIEDADRDLYERAFKHRQKRLPSPPSLSVFDGAYPSLAPILSFQPKADWVYEREVRKIDDAIRAEADQRTQLKAATAERDRLLGELLRVGKPIGVASAIWLLGVLSIGVVVPVGVMAFDPESLNPWAKGGLIVSFVGGLAAILIYVGWFWRNIGNESEETTSATSPEGPS